MQPNPSGVLGLFADTIRDPSAVAARIKGLRLPHEAGWIVMALATIGVVILLYLERLMPNSTAAATAAGFIGTPILDAVIMGALSVLMVFVFYMMGRAMGGMGSFGATLAIMAWFQVFVLILLVIQVVVSFLLAGLAGLVAIASLILQVFVLVNFLNVLHGYDNIFKALGLMVASVLGLGFGLAIIVVIIGGVSAAGGA